MTTITDFFAGGWSDLEENPDDDEKREIELDAFDPAGLVWINS